MKNMTGTQKMKFDVGDSIIYPGYGVGQVLELQERVLDNSAKTFLVLSFKEAENESKVMIPLANVQGVGLRPPSPRKEVKRSMDFLAEGAPDILPSWKDRFNAHSALLAQGGLFSVAQVLKALWILNRKKPLSFREKKMYQKALLLMSSEVALVLGRKREATELQILDLLSKVP